MLCSMGSNLELRSLITLHNSYYIILSLPLAPLGHQKVLGWVPFVI